MYYSSEEMLNYIKENELEMDVFIAMLNNEKGFYFLPVDAKLMKKNDEYYCNILSLDNMILPINPEINEEFEEILKKPKYCEFAIIKKENLENTQWELVLTFNKNKQERIDELHYKAFLIFIEYCKINTRGKLLTIIAKGKEILEQETGFPNLFGI